MKDINNNLEFSSLFKKYRLRSEIESLSLFTDLLKKEGEYYDKSLFTKWQKGDRKPSNRRLLLSIIKIFVKRGGVGSINEANTLFKAAGLTELTTTEITRIDSSLCKYRLLLSSELSENKYKSKDLYSKLEWNLSHYASEVFVIYTFIFLTAYWFISPIGRPPTIFDFTVIYIIMSIVGVVFGLLATYRFGLRKNTIGRSILYFSIGLFCQVLGQAYYTSIAFANVNGYLLLKNLYPSIGDLAYLASLILYIFGLIEIINTYQLKFKFKINKDAFIVFLVPFLLFSISFYKLISTYNFNSGHALIVVLDFIYPLTHTIFFSISFFIFLNTKDIFGELKTTIRVLIVAMLFQYISDFTFIYLSQQKEFIIGGIGDYLYLVTYFLTTIAFIQMNKVATSLKREIY